MIARTYSTLGIREIAEAMQAGKGGPMNTNIRASVTVEATLVSIAILMVVFLSVTFTLWLRDRTYVTALLAEAVEVTRNQSPEEAAYWLSQEIEVLFFTRGQATGPVQEGLRVQASFTGDSSQLWMGISTQFQEEFLRRIWEPGRLLRLWELVK